MRLKQGANVRVRVRLKPRSRAAARPLPATALERRPAHWLSSIGNWLTALILVYCSGGGTFSFFDPEGNTQMGAMTGVGGKSVIGTMGARLVLVALLYLALRASSNVRRAALTVPSLALLNCMGLISCIWSAFPLFSLKQGLYLLITYAFAISFIFKPAELQMRLMQLAGVISVFFCAVTAILFPQYGLNGRQGVTGEWEGIYAGKNVCAMAMIFLLMPALYLKPATTMGRVLRVLYICSLLLVVGLTRSRTGWALAALLVLFSFGINLLARFKSFDRRVLSITLCASVLIIGVLVATHLQELFSFIGRDLTFSGRTQIWSAILDSIHKRPLTGYGYRAFWMGMTGESANVMMKLGWVMGYAHSGFLSVWLEVGLFGLILLGICLLKGLKDAWFCLMRNPSPQVLWYITIIVFGILYNVDEASFLFRFQLVWILVIGAIVGLDQKRREIRSVSASVAVHG